MLSNDDLQAIGTIVDEKLQANNGWIDKMFDVKLEPVLEAVRDGFEEMDRNWDKKLDEKLDKGLGSLRHELMDHTDRTVSKAVGDLRSELRERDLIG